jgi:hypothetical protein
MHHVACSVMIYAQLIRELRLLKCILAPRCSATRVDYEYNFVTRLVFATVSGLVFGFLQTNSQLKDVVYPLQNWGTYRFPCIAGRRKHR